MNRLSPPDGWRLLGADAGAFASPVDLPALDHPDWQPATVPGTVASALSLPLDTREPLDDRDWWYVAAVELNEGGTVVFDGLATIAEVWLDGVCVATSRNMFRPVELAEVEAGAHFLALCFRALSPVLAATPRRPPPRWRTALVDDQRLRYVRTSLLGRIPGWTPPLPAVGPWRDIRVVAPALVRREQVHLVVGVRDGVAHLTVRVPAIDGVGGLRVQVGDREWALVAGDDWALDVDLPDQPLWWPNGAGDAALSEARLLVDGADEVVELGRVGFRSVDYEDAADGAVLRVNGVPVFARGACWTVTDVRSLDGTPEDTARILETAASLGLNLLRVGGTMTWPSDALLDACDRLGILLWQDLMVANMDLPLHNDPFRADLEAEVRYQLGRLQGRPCVAAVCGGSEVHQQAAMMGRTGEALQSDLFDRFLPEVVAETLPGTPVFASTPTGGVLPFHTGAGLTHYYGVGAYLRPLEDARRARVHFTPECLGFANVPDDRNLEHLPRGAATPPHHPDWKAGVPRDNGAGWDFDDVRDHYFRLLWGLDPFAVRYADTERYRAISRVVSAEVMLRTFAEWRRPDSPCGGAVVWFLHDLRPGAGWGILDSDGLPKVAAHALRRAWAPRAVLWTDEGLDGAALHIHNELGEAFSGTVEVLTCSSLHGVVRSASRPVELGPRSAESVLAEAVFGAFADPVHAYRFGPSAHDALVARLLDSSGEVVHEDVLFVGGHHLPMQAETVLAGEVAVREDGTVAVTLQSDRLLQGVTVDAKGLLPLDAGFHLTPGRPRTVRLQPEGTVRRVKVRVAALNLAGALTLRG